MCDSSNLRYTYSDAFRPTMALGELMPRTCGLCHREMTIDGEWYRCLDHGLCGRIQTVEEAEEENRTCDPRWRT